MTSSELKRNTSSETPELVRDGDQQDAPQAIVTESVTEEQLEAQKQLDEASREEAREKARREREARAQALTLEIVGDLPYAEVKPPENVLFVCKLNPVTEGSLTGPPQFAVACYGEFALRHSDTKTHR